jgi:electron transfer flavoprotein alpha subunit
MFKVLIIAEHLDGKLNPSTAKCVSAALAFAPESIDIVVLAADPAPVAAEAAAIAGVSKVLTVTGDANLHAAPTYGRRRSPRWRPATAMSSVRPPPSAKT